MAQSNPELVDFSDADTFGQRMWDAPSISETYPELSLDDICARIYDGADFCFCALKNAGVLLFIKFGSQGNALFGWNDERDIPNFLILPITQQNLDAAHSIEYDEYDNPIFEGFFEKFEYFD